MVHWMMAGVRFRAGVVLGACSVVAYAYPGVDPPGIVPPGIIPIVQPSVTKNPLSNTTVSPTPTPTESESSCSASCTVELPAWSALSWVPATDLVYTSTITVATKIYSIDKGNNFTVTRTQYTPLPDGLTFQSLATNDAGTIYASHFVTGDDGFKTFTQLAYPTPYFDYASEYNWQGVLPTADKTGNTFCDTATAPNTAVLPSYTAYPQPKAGRPDPADLEGLGYTLLWVTQSKEFDTSFLSSAFPSVSAFAVCTPTPFPVTPTASPITTVKFLTATETTYANFSSAPIVHTEKSVSGFESSTPIKTLPPPSAITTAMSVRTENTASGFEDPPTTVKPNRPDYNNPGRPENSSPVYPGGSDNPPATSEKVHAEHSVSGFGPPSVKGGGSESRPTALPNENPPLSRPAAAQNGKTTAGAAGGASAISTIAILTTVSGIPTAVVGYVLPNGATATAGQTVVVGGKTTVLGVDGAGPVTAAETAVPTVLIASVKGEWTSTTAWVLPGGSTASIGQTVTMSGGKTVLGAPGATNDGDAVQTGKAKDGNNKDKSAASRLGFDNQRCWIAGLTMLIMMV